MYNIQEIIKKKKAREEYERKLQESQNELLEIRDNITNDMKKELAVIEQALNDFREKYKEISKELSLEFTVQYGIKPEIKIEPRTKIKFDVLQGKSKFDENKNFGLVDLKLNDAVGTEIDEDEESFDSEWKDNWGESEIPIKPAK